MTKTEGDELTPSAMPPLRAAEYEALTESVREHGIIVPVVVDQTGFLLDGHNRVAIAQQLGEAVPSTTFECKPDQREVLRIELNGARRQLGPDQWQPLVDHLRAQVNDQQVRRFSDRVIARAVGVDKNTVHRYKPKEKVGVPTGTPTLKATGQDGKIQVVNGDWTAIDRALHLIRQSSTGLTAHDLRLDPILAEFGSSTISKLPTMLYERGLVEQAGKRDRSTVWLAVPDAEPQPPPTNLDHKVQRIAEDLADPEVREGVRTVLAGTKEARKVEAVVQQAQKEVDAARLDRERREAEAEKERQRLEELARDQLDKSVKMWDGLIKEVQIATERLARYNQLIDDLPPLTTADVRTLDRGLVALRRQLDWLDEKVHPYGNGTPLVAGTIIDVT